MDNLFGLPAHPLVVHAAVVLLPLAAIATVVAAIPRWRRPYAAAAFVVALCAAVAVWLAQESGESLEDRVVETELLERHTEMAEQVLPWAIALTIVAGAVVVADQLSSRSRKIPATAMTVTLLLATGVTATGATWTIVEVGHSGAKATWSDIPASDDDD